MKEKDITRTLRLVRKGSATAGWKPEDDISDEFSVKDFFVKAFRHKLLMAAIIFGILSAACALYAYRGTWYSRTNISQFNNFENNALFFIMDTLIPADGDTRRSDNKQEYASRAVSALSADDFLKFVYEVAREDKQLAQILASEGIQVTGDLSPETFDQFRSFFDGKVKISAPQGGGGILKLQTTGYFLTSFKGPNREFVDKFSSHMSRLMSQYLSKREVEDVQATRQLVIERLQGFKKEILDLNNRRAKLVSETPHWSAETYNILAMELENARSTFKGNKAVMVRLGYLFDEMEKKVRALNEGTAEDDSVENLDRDLQKTLARLRGVVNDSKAQIFSDSKYQSRFDGNKDYDQKMLDVYFMKQQFVYSEAKFKALEDELISIRDQINKRYSINNEIEDIAKAIATKQKLTDSLEASKIRLDFADFKTLRRVEVFTGPIKQESIMPLGSFAMLSLIVALFMGITAAFAAERKNPSLTTPKAFEELNVPVIGSIPSTKDFLMNDAILNGAQDGRVMSYVRLAINISNVLTYIHSKIVLFTASDHQRQSATTVFNLGSYFANTGRRVLMIEADFESKFLDVLTGNTTDGGLSDVLSYSKEVNIKPVEILPNLHLLSGDSSQLPPVYRLASEGFLDLLEELKKEYDYIFIHSRPCLESPEAADLSRYVGVVVLSVDANTIRLNHLERLTDEMKLFLSKYSYLVLENADDGALKYNPRKLLKRNSGPSVKPPVTESGLRKAG